MTFGVQSVNTVAQYWYNALLAQKDALGLADVFYGDQSQIPRTPTVAVIAGQKQRTLTGAPLRTGIDFTVYFIIYHNKVQDTQVTFEESIAFAEAVENLVHADPNLGGQILFGMVELTEPGLAVRSGTMLRATRLTWIGHVEPVGLTTP